MDKLFSMLEITAITQTASVVLLALSVWTGWKIYKFGKTRTAPDVCVFLSKTRDSKTEEDISGFWDLTVKNFGPSTAYNIKFKIEPDVEFHCSPKGKIRLSDHSVFKGVTYLVPDDKRSFFLGSQFKGNNSYIPFETSFNVEVVFTDKHNKKYQNQFTIDFSQLSDIVWSNKSK